MLSKPIMNPLTKLTLITCSQTKHTQNSASESAHRRTSEFLGQDGYV